MPFTCHRTDELHCPLREYNQLIYTVQVDQSGLHNTKIHGGHKALSARQDFGCICMFVQQSQIDQSNQGHDIQTELVSLICLNDLWDVKPLHAQPATDTSLRCESITSAMIDSAIGSSSLCQCIRSDKISRMVFTSLVIGFNFLLLDPFSHLVVEHARQFLRNRQHEPRCQACELAEHIDVICPLHECGAIRTMPSTMARRRPPGL